MASGAPPESLAEGGLPRGGPLKRLVVGALAVAAAGALALLYIHRPEGQFFFPRCAFHAATGLYCPGCGGLRSAHLALHGEFLEAFKSNALLVAGLPAALVFWVARRRRPGGLSLSPLQLWLIAAVVIAFGVLRNIRRPPFDFFAP
jgi:hypothetical protein